MSLSRHNLKPAKGARTGTKRVGRGNASGKGTTAGRGTKGQAARTGGRNRRKLRGFRSIMLSTPKLRGFKSGKAKPAIADLGQIDKAFKSGETVTPQNLQTRGIVTSAGAGVKILSGGKLKKKLLVSGCTVSASAKAKIEAAGGEVRA